MPTSGFRLTPWRTVVLLAVLLASLPLTVVGQQPAWSVATQSVFPGSSWEMVSSPEAVGFDAQRLRTVEDYVKTLNTTGLMVVVLGRVLMARVGYLMLREGTWGDRQVIPGDWARGEGSREVALAARRARDGAISPRSEPGCQTRPRGACPIQGAVIPSM
jgi:hypothetical protein